MDELLLHSFGADNVQPGLSLPKFVQKQVGFRTVDAELNKVFVFERRIGDGKTFGKRVWSQSTSWSMAELIDQCILKKVTEKYESKFRKKDVLSLGYYKRYFGAEGDGVKMRRTFTGGCSVHSLLKDLECRCPNAAVNFLKRPSWQNLLQGVGDELMTHLLLNCILLLKVGSSFMQLTGPILNAQLGSVGTDIMPSAKVNASRKKIDRTRIFYSTVFARKCGLPNQHVLNDETIGGKRLSKLIFQTEERVGQDEFRRRRVWATHLLKRHRACPYGKLLERICPIDKENEMQKEVIELCAPRAKVSEFLKAITLRVLPRSTFRSKRSRRAFLEVVHQLVFLPRNEVIYVDVVVTETGVSFDIVNWWFNQVLISLLRAVFYCTEADGVSNEIFYYRKPLWQRVCSRELESMIARRQIEKSNNHLPVRQGLGRTTSGVIQPTSMLRFVPKAKGGLRPIMNCKTQNHKLTYVFHALTAAFRAQAGRQILGLVEFHKHFHQFIEDLGRDTISQNSWHILTMDIEKCFDNIVHEKLFRAVRSLLKEPSYTIEGFNTVFVNRTLKRVRSITKRLVDDSSGYVDFMDRVRASTYRNCVFIDRAESMTITAKEIMQKVRAHVGKNYIQFENQLYLQKQGIPQGSILSSLLCVIYFQQFEREHVDAMFKNDPSTFCSRMLDDYLVISNDRVKLERFAKMMENGFPSHGIKVKREKTKLSDENLPTSTSSGSQISWCGYSINSQDLSVSFDSERFEKMLSQGGKRDANRSKEEQLRQAMQLIALRSNPLLFDGGMNSLDTIKVNIRNLFRLAKRQIAPEFRQELFLKVLRFMLEIVQAKSSGYRPFTIKMLRSIGQAVFF